MKSLLALSRLIDTVNRCLGRAVTWLILVVVVVSATNAVVRKFFNVSSNAWLELQWYMFGAIFLLCAGYTLLKNEHVRVDVVAQRLSRRTQIKIEIFGILFFLLPASVLIAYLSWFMFADSWVTQEYSSNSGGLIRWPAKLLIPVGFFFLIAAGISHLIKCIAFLTGDGPDPMEKLSEKSAEALLAEEIAREAAERDAAARHTGTTTGH
ncbi:TRAP transporter small permease subunit [Allopusillimonas ginsengisoli]|uniref:TRAP transporter small permease subunit n=1 Tax=Allopusillimonas ginsengisoli TaxID=453575 RepID=UPI001021DE7C|nr:TRAP transporter small permease subunit [Allopusillimonas ginsengisoli]TEA78206.1 TRAP transporter small permease subunit [Allopusillimonas ginsengisoli]